MVRASTNAKRSPLSIRRFTSAAVMLAGAVCCVRLDDGSDTDDV
jgi:hypothetical protein